MELDRQETTGHDRPPRIVVGVDGSTGADDACTWAAAEASRRGARLTVVVAWPVGRALLAEDDARRTAERAAANVASRHPEVVVDAVAHEGHPAEVLIRVAGGADLLVVGARGSGGFRRLLLGSVGVHCMHHAPCPIAVVRAPEGGPFAGSDPAIRRIVVGVDGSNGSDRAVDWAADEARRTGADLDILSSWMFAGTSSYLMPVDLGVPGAAKQAAQEAQGRAEQATPGLRARIVTCEDPPVVALIDAAHNADLVVVGSRGLGAFREMLLGSVSTYVAEHAECSVVAVR